jgi:hypothetical protein
MIRHVGLYLLLMLCIAIFPVTLTFASIKGDFNFIKTYKSIAGAVTFNHQNHTVRFTDKCGFCHSALKTFGGKVDEMFGLKVCRVCHESHDGSSECTGCYDKGNIAKK